MLYFFQVYRVLLYCLICIVCIYPNPPIYGGAMHKSTRLFISLIDLLGILLSMTGSACAAPPAPRAKWTVMVYIAGDNYLEDYVVKDIELELAPTGSSANVQVVALADRAPGYDTSRGDWQSTKLYHVTQGMIADSASAVADWGER